MKNLKKTALAVFAVCIFVLCTTFCAANVSAAEVVDSGECGDNLTWVLYDDGELVIEGEGKMWSGCRWGDYRDSITNITINDGVTSIGSEAFYSCKSLTNVTIPNSVTSIGNRAFRDCERLTNIILPNSIKDIGSSAFFNCNSLTSFSIPNGVDAISDTTFYECTSLTSITIPDSIVYIGDSAFQYCKNLTNVTLPEGVTTLFDDIFNGCTNLTSMNIPNGVRYIPKGTFYNCHKLASITIGNNVSVIEEEAFYNCTSLTSVDIPDSVTYIGESAFWNCKNLSSVTIADSVSTIEDFAFSYCSKLKKVTIPSSVTFIGVDAFWSCSSLEEITVLGNITAINTGMFRDCNSLASVTIPDSVTSIGSSAFYGCTGLASVTIPDSVTSIGSSAFNGCTGLVSITIPDSVASIGNSSFCGCDSLTSVTIPDSVTSIGEDAFYSCDSLTSITIGNSVTSIGEDAFYYCTDLTSVTIPDSVTSIGYGAFYGCDSLISVTVLSRDVKYGSRAFFGTPSNLILYGYTGSTTEAYASANGHNFVSLDSLDTEVPETEAPETEPVGGESQKPEVDLNAITVNWKTQSIIDQFQIKVNDVASGAPVKGAKVVLGDAVELTGEDGIAVFERPSASTTALSISADGYNTYTVKEYTIPQDQSMDTFTIGDITHPYVIPKTCNGININTGYAQINNKANLYAEIVVDGYSYAGINCFKLYQNDTLLAESEDGTFKLHNSVFKKGVPIVASMVMKNGVSVTTELNIRVVSFTLTNTDFTISGSKVRIPHDVPLVGGIELEFKEVSQLPDYDVTNEHIKVGYGQTVKDKDLSKLNSGLRKWMQEHNRKTPSSNFSFDVGGYIMINVNHKGVEKTTGQLYIAAQYSNGFNKTFILWAIPVNVDVRFTVSGEIVIEDFGYDFENAKIILPAVNGSIGGKITAKAGVGVKWLSAGIYGSLSLTLDLNILPAFMVDSLVADGELGIYAKAVLLGETKLPIFGGNDKWVLYSKDRSLTAHSLQALADAVYDESNYTVGQRAYLANRTTWHTTADGVLQESSYDNANPKIASANGTTVMVFVDDNGSTDSYNYQQLVYSAHTDDGWSTPVPVEKNNLNDAEFDLYSDGKNIWVLYTEAKRLITAEDDFEDYASLLEVKAARFDPITKTFTDHAVLTDNNYMDRLPSISIILGDPVAVWVENADNNLFGMSGNNTLYLSSFKDDKWQTPTVVLDNLSAISELDMGMVNGDFCIAFIIDEDNNFATSDDRKLTAMGERLFYTNVGSVSNALSTPLIPPAVYAEGECSGISVEGNSLYWYSPGTIHRAAELNGSSEIVSDTLSADSAGDFRMISDNGEKIILYRTYNTEGEHGGSDIYAIRESSAGWTLPVRLTQTEGYIDSFAAVAADDHIQLVYRLTDVSFGEENMTVICDLHAETAAYTDALVITDLSYDHEDLFDDDIIKLLVTVKNNGISAASDFRINVGDTAFADYDGTLQSGESAEIEITYTMPSETKEITVAVTNSLGILTTQNITVGYADFSVSLEAKTVAGKPYISASVVNSGNISGSGTLYLRSNDKTGTAFYTETLQLAPGEQMTVFAEVLDGTLEQVYMDFIPSEDDYFSEDNHTYCSIMREKKETTIIGDIDNNGMLNIADAIALFRYSMMPDLYPISYSGSIDFTKDEIVNINDAILLFRHSMMPDLYPLE